MTRSLYQIAAEYAALLDAPDDADVEALLGSVGGELEAKAVAIAHVLRELDAEADTIRAEEVRLADRRQAHERRAARIREYLRASMEQAGVAKVKHALFTISLRQGPGRVVVLDASQVPAEYLHAPKAPEVDRRAVMDAAKRGEAVPGCTVEYGTSLQIR